MDVVDLAAESAAHRAPFGRLRIAPGDPGERIRIEQVREGPNSVGEIGQPVVDRPLADLILQRDTEGEVGRPAGLDRRLQLAGKRVPGKRASSTCLPVSCSNAATIS